MKKYWVSGTKKEYDGKNDKYKTHREEYVIEAEDKTDALYKAKITYELEDMSVHGIMEEQNH